MTARYTSTAWWHCGVGAHDGRVRPRARAALPTCLSRPRRPPQVIDQGQCLDATLQPGNQLVVSGYCLYSAATALVLSFGGKTCQGFTLDESVGEFVLTNPNMKIPKRGKPIYSINEVRAD